MAHEYSDVVFYILSIPLIVFSVVITTAMSKKYFDGYMNWIHHDRYEVKK